MKDEIEQKKICYPNGKLRAEISYKQGVPHGYQRVWHENGILASENYFNYGAPEGVGRQWDKDGNLLFSYKIRNGTGIQKVWYANQGFWAEISWVNGKMTGRQRTYSIDDGAIMGDTFWIENEEVSKKNYIEACKTDPNLPRYAKECDKPKKTKRSDTLINTVEGSVNSKCRIDEEDFVSELLASKDIQEALSWLTESNVPERSLGEAQEREVSIALVKSLYKLGAKNVWVFDIDGDLDEEQNSGRLIVELSEDRNERHKLLVKCAEIGAAQGFDAEPDTGQRYTLLMLD